MEILCSRDRILFGFRVASFFFFASGVFQAAFAQSTFREGFEGPDPSWVPAQADVRYQLTGPTRVRDVTHSGSGSERITISAANGSYVYFQHPIAQARVLAELQAGLWIKSDRPGMQMMLGVVLPRSLDPRTKEPIKTLLHGSSYTQVGAWQRLSIGNLPQMLERQERVLRRQFGPQVDAREAYVDRVFINTYGGQGTTTLWIDELEVAGVIGPQTAIASAQASGRLPAATSTDAFRTPAQGSGQSQPWKSNAQPQATSLSVNSRLTLPRIIQHRGEALVDLKRLGFTVVMLPTRPAETLLVEASRLGLWLVCPPPTLTDLDRTGIPSAYDPVLAWSLGEGLTDEQLPGARRLAQALRAKDPQQGRPLLAAPVSHLRAYSRIADVLLVGRDPIGTTMELVDYRKWLQGQSQLVRPGTPIWVRIQTDLEPQLLAQWAALSRAETPGTALQLQAPPSPQAVVEAAQIRLQIQSSLAAGTRGLVFGSYRSLGTNDLPTRYRRAGLELLNIELSLIEPWAASGSFSTPAKTTEGSPVGVTLQAERARLLLPLRPVQADQMVVSPSSSNVKSFIVPGVPESNDAYEFSPAVLRPLLHKRVTGGIRVSNDPLAAGSMILMTGDPLILSGLSRRVAQTRHRAAQLNRELAATRLQQMSGLETRLATATRSGASTSESLSDAHAHLQQCDALLARGDDPGAYASAQQTLDAIARNARSRWQTAVRSWPSLVTSPWAVNVATIPQHLQFAASLRAAQAAPTILPLGHFENLSQMVEAGWRHVQYATPGVSSDVELSLEEPHSGRLSLHLSAWPEKSDAVPPLVESVPLWVTTPAVPVEAGTLYRIHGWVRIPQAITGTVDGLRIIDSLGGHGLSERVGKTEGWSEFTLYRASGGSGQLTVTFALSGIGEVWLDDVTIEPIVFPQARQTQQLRTPVR